MQSDRQRGTFLFLYRADCLRPGHPRGTTDPEPNNALDPTSTARLASYRVRDEFTLVPVAAGVSGGCGSAWSFGSIQIVSADRDSKIIGYYALAGRKDIVCSGSGCFIAGSEASMREFVEESDPVVARDISIHKIRFAEIVAGLKRGAPYSFEEASFARFYPLATEIRLPIPNLDFAEAHARGDRILTVRLVSA